MDEFYPKIHGARLLSGEEICMIDELVFEDLGNIIENGYLDLVSFTSKEVPEK